MKKLNLWTLVVLILVGLQLIACQKQADTHIEIKPAVIEQDTQGINRIRLTAKAVERLGIKTDPVREIEVDIAGIKTQRKVVPYSSVLYDAQGNTMLYINPEPFVFIQQKITVDYIEGDQAILTVGPEAGIVVVTVGSAELIGIDSGVGH